jgi:hypothetical protein
VIWVRWIEFSIKDIFERVSEPSSLFGSLQVIGYLDKASVIRNVFSKYRYIFITEASTVNAVYMLPRHLLEQVEVKPFISRDCPECTTRKAKLVHLVAGQWPAVPIT